VFEDNVNLGEYKDIEMSKSWRKIHIDEDIWTYKIPRKGIPYTILIRDPENKRHLAKTSDVMGMTNYDIERGYGKGWLSITPSHIKTYIENCILKKKDLYREIIVEDKNES